MKAGKLFVPKDNTTALELQRVWQVLANIGADNVNTDELCAHLGQHFKDGQVEALVRFATGQWPGTRLDIVQAAGAPCLYLDSTSGSGDIVDSSIGAVLDSTGHWLDACSGSRKTYVSIPDPLDILERSSQLAVGVYRRSDVDSPIRHISPTAEGFHELFDVGSPGSLSALDVASVAILAIQGLAGKVRKLENRLQEIEAKGQ